MDNFDDKKLRIAVFAIGFLIPLLFAVYTDHAWEDWYITYRASKNLALGNGLVFTVGERVHSFTSPLGTLIPAFFNFITGNYSDSLVLWLFRLFNCLLIGFTAVMLCNMAKELTQNTLAKIFLLSMLLFDVKTIDFSINGMETALMIFFLALLLYSQIMPLKKATLVMGLAWGGLMWTRPDSFIYVSGISLGFLLFNPQMPTSQTRLERFKGFIFAGLIATSIYIPWLVFAWLYYGSFVPHTVIAKGLTFENLKIFSLLKEVLFFPISSIGQVTSLDKTFMPSYSVENYDPDFSKLYLYISKILAWVSAFIWVFRVRAITCAISLAVFIGHIYLNFVMLTAFPWYFPSVTFLSILVLTLSIDQMLSFLESISSEGKSQLQYFQLKAIKFFFRQTIVLCVLLALSLLFSGAYRAHIQQYIIEINHRKNIGLWLHDIASPKDRVFLECLGYIGFYSELKMYDFPGLSSPEVVATRRKLKTDDFGEIIDYLKPEWVVLRPKEITLHFSDSSIFKFAKNYTIAKKFVAQELSNDPYLVGKTVLEFDRTFFVYHINPSVKNIQTSK